MLQAFVDEGLEDDSVFSLFVRRLPEPRNYLVACGLSDILRYLEELRFEGRDLDYLASLGLFSDSFLRRLEAFRFEGDVHAVPEGTPVFANEPLLEVVAPLPQAQIVETFALNQITLQTALASKASRVVTAARGRHVVDFGLRRMHGLDAGLKSARAFYIAGVHGTSNVAAGQRYGIPVQGTMAHSYIQAHEREVDAFVAFARRYPHSVLLVDTYDTLAAVRAIVDLARQMGPAFSVRAIRLDSGDLATLARDARRVLDDGGLTSVEIFVSGGLDEHTIADLLRRGAPIDGFGVGSDMAVSRDAPSLDAVYKLVSFRGRGTTKLSAGKGVLPGRKQVFRIEEDGSAVRDVIALADEEPPAVPPSAHARPLLVPVMRGGRRLPDAEASLTESRARARAELARLPDRIRAIEPADSPYEVTVSPALQKMHDDLVARVHASRP